MPLCFTSFDFIRDNFHSIKNQASIRFDIDHLEGNEILAYLDLQPLNSIECQVVDEDFDVGTYDQIMQDDYVPLCFESFQFLKGISHSISSNEQPLKNHIMSLNQ